MLGTALNPANDHPRFPLNEADVDDDLDINARNSTAPKEFTVFEPDEDFESSPTPRTQQQQNNGDIK